MKSTRCRHSLNIAENVSASRQDKTRLSAVLFSLVKLIEYEPPNLLFSNSLIQVTMMPGDL